MISKALGTSKRFAKLGGYEHGEFYQLLFPLLVSFTDDFGRVEGDSFSVKVRVFPVSPRTEAEFEDAIVALCEVGLIQRYEANDRVRGPHQCVIQVAQWEEHQTGLHKRTKSKFPDPPGETFKQDNQGKTLAEVFAKENGEASPSGRAGCLVAHFLVAHKELMKQPYVQSRSQAQRDLDAASALVEAYDDTALDKIIRMYLTVDEEHPKARLLRGSQRTLPKLLTMAGSLAEALKIEVSL